MHSPNCSTIAEKANCLCASFNAEVGVADSLRQQFRVRLNAKGGT